MEIANFHFFSITTLHRETSHGVSEIKQNFELTLEVNYISLQKFPHVDKKKKLPHVYIRAKNQVNK